MKSNPLIALPFVLAAFALVGCADESPEKRIASANEYLQKNDTKSAVIEIKNALQKNPDSGEARFLLGSTLLKEGNPVAAEVELRKAQAAKFPEVQVVPELARAMLMLGQAKKVVDEFGQARLGTPTADAKLQTLLAAAYGALGKPDQAQAALTAALAADPKYADALLVSARQKASARDIDGAMAVVDDVVARESGNADAWKLKGDLMLYAKNQPEEALSAYRKALAAEPKYMAAHAAIFSVLMQQGKPDEAAKQVEELKKFAAKNPQTRFFEAHLAYQKKDFKLAREVAQELLQQAPNNPRLLELAGAAELQLGVPTQAQIYLAKALQLAPGLPLARRLLIVTHLRSGQPAKALAELNTATGKDGVPPALYGLAGEVHLQNGDAKKAEEYFAKALKLDPDDARKRTALAITHLAGGKGDMAIGELQDIAGSDSGTAADLALISTYLRSKDFPKALAAIDKLEAKQPDKPLAANLRGRVLLAQKDNAGARKSFERALSIDPNYFAAAASLAALDVADKKPDDAKKRFEALLAKNPKNGQALLALAQLAANQRASRDEIAALLNRAIDANPTDAAPRLLLTDLYLRNKDNKQALAAAQSAATAVPNSPELLMALGRVQQVSGDVNQAIATYSKLVALQPLSPMPHLRLAEAYVANKDNKAAEQSLRKALDIKPDFLEAQRALIMLAVEAKMYPDAIRMARTVQQQRPKVGLGLMLEGDVNVARRDWVAAAASYKAALQLDPATELATKHHAATVQAGKAKEAEQFAATWVAAHPKDARFSAYLAEAALSRKDYAAAEKLYQGVLQMQPDSALALNNLAWVTLQLQKDGALAYAEKANQLAPKQPQFMDTLAMVLSAKGEHAKAIELQTQAVTLQPANNALKLNMARIYVAAGDKARARTELDALAKLNGRLPLQQEVAQLLKTL
jgi:putative PEP-CTERM system TPR-repeat lipoprotein